MPLVRMARALLFGHRSATRLVTALRHERGATLPELVVGLGMLIVVVGTLMVPVTMTQADQTRDANYDYAQQQARAGLDSMVADLRQATSIISSGPVSVEMNVSLQGQALLVYYECDIVQPGSAGRYHECIRVQAPAGGQLPPLSAGTVVIQNLLNGTTSSPVFTWGPDPVAPYYMTASVTVPASDGANGGLSHSIVLSDGALMRNLNVGN